jgi:HSP20 family protein
MTTLVPVRRESGNLWDVAEELDRVFDSPFDLLPATRVREGLWHPTVNVYNRPHEIIVELEVPGVKMEDLDLTVEDNHLVVEGTRSRAEEFKEEDRIYSERAFGAFHRVVHLPAYVDAEKSEARLNEGLLVICLPKTKREGGRKIEVKTQ